jgi:hypothetical protein
VAPRGWAMVGGPKPGQAPLVLGGECTLAIASGLCPEFTRLSRTTRSKRRPPARRPGCLRGYRAIAHWFPLVNYLPVAPRVRA